MAEIKGKGLPTKQTKGALGDIYLDKDTNKKYKCTGSYSIKTHANLKTEYEWKEFKFNNTNKVNKAQENSNDITKKSAGGNFEKTFEKVQENTTEDIKNQSTVSNDKDNKHNNNNNNNNYNKYYKK